MKKFVFLITLFLSVNLIAYSQVTNELGDDKVPFSVDITSLLIGLVVGAAGGYFLGKGGSKK